MGEGLDRRRSIHAIGGIFIGLLSDMTRMEETGIDFNTAYESKLVVLTVENWLGGAE